MDAATRPTQPEPSSANPESARDGFRQLRVATIFGLLGQLLIWGSVIALWIVGSVYANIPVQTDITYGANGIHVQAWAIFALNYLLIAGAVVALVSLFLASRSYRKIGTGARPLNFDAVLSLTTVGAIGLGMFAVGWAIWLGSFVAPGPSAVGTLSEYAPVIDPNISLVVDLMLTVGGLLAFLGMVGLAWGNSKVGTTYEEGAIELGGALSTLPVFSVIGYALSLFGLVRGEHKLKGGWVPPVPTLAPPPPIYTTWSYPAGYPAGTPIAVSGRGESMDGLVALMIGLLIVLWVIILPFTIVLSTDQLSRGPSNGPIGPNGSVPPSTAPSSASTSTVPVVLLVGLAATAVLLPLAILRHRRKRQRPVTPPLPPPPPPSPPPGGEGDSLDHLV